MSLAICSSFLASWSTRAASAGESVESVCLTVFSTYFSVEYVRIADSMTSVAVFSRFRKSQLFYLRFPAQFDMSSIPSPCISPVFQNVFLPYFTIWIGGEQESIVLVVAFDGGDMAAFVLLAFEFDTRAPHRSRFICQSANLARCGFHRVADRLVGRSDCLTLLVALDCSQDLAPRYQRVVGEPAQYVNWLLER